MPESQPYSPDFLRRLRRHSQASLLALPVAGASALFISLLGGPGTSSACANEVLAGFPPSWFLLLAYSSLTFLTCGVALWMLANMHDVRKFQKPISQQLVFGVYLIFWVSVFIAVSSLAWSLIIALTNTPITGC
jgi:hypothetical protein